MQGKASRSQHDELARAAELESIHRAVTTGSEPDYGLAQARGDMELSILITESARRGEPLQATSEALRPETEWEREQHEEFRESCGADPIEDVDALVKNPTWFTRPLGRGAG